MTLTEILRREHELIVRGLGVLRALADRAGRAPVSTEAARELVAFFREFADAAHHDREERALFPALEDHGMPRQGGPVGCMLHEHEEGRELVGDMAEAAERGLETAGEAERFRGAAHQYASLLDQHIHKENHVLFEMAERMLPEALNRRMGEEHADRHEEAWAKHRPVIERLEAEHVLGGAGSAGEHAQKDLGHHVR